jgi:AAHS family 4-hydroxybenzoate transporter-like MFS transporter
MSLERSPLRLPDFVDEHRVSGFQYGVITLCGLVMFLDGFDTQAISYMAPHIAQDWGLSRDVLGPIFSSALVGLMVGYLVLSPLSDRFGHKRVIVVSTLGFGLCTLAAVWAGGVTELMVLRFLTGLGLGAAAPSCIAMTGEFSPKRLRATFVLAIYCGFSLGFVVAGLVAGWLIPLYGWRSMFVVGALAPIVLVPLLAWILPESPVFMIRRGHDPQRIHRVFRRMDRSLPAEQAPRFAVPSEDSGQRAALSSLFTRDRVLGTVLLWLVFAINLAEFYALQSWLPTILTGMDHDMSVVVAATTLTTVGGIAAAFVTGPAMDRIGAYRALGVFYLAGAVFVAGTGIAFGAPLWVLMVATFLAGCAISGGQKSLIALAAVFYPASMRSTGLGWALGIGRVGGILGPIILGAALAADWAAGTLFLAMGIPVLVSGLAVLFLDRRYGTRDGQAAAAVPTPSPAEPSFRA